MFAKSCHAGSEPARSVDARIPRAVMYMYQYGPYNIDDLKNMGKVATLLLAITL